MCGVLSVCVCPSLTTISRPLYSNGVERKDVFSITFISSFLLLHFFNLIYYLLTEMCSRLSHLTTLFYLFYFTNLSNDTECLLFTGCSYDKACT